MLLTIFLWPGQAAPLRSNFAAIALDQWLRRVRGGRDAQLGSLWLCFAAAYVNRIRKVLPTLRQQSEMHASCDRKKCCLLLSGNWKMPPLRAFETAAILDYGSSFN